MEPIRPDDDELRASRDEKSQVKQPQKPAAKAQKPVQKARRGPSGPLFLIALLALTGAGVASWYSQNQRIARMESQLEEADYWARQSKLALARFEGELSETGEDLQQAGQSIEQRLSDQAERLKTANSEIRKLWGVANDRNKSRLNDHESRLEAQATALSSIKAQQQEFTSSFSGLEKTLSSQGDRLDGQQSTLKELQASLASIDDQIDGRLTRFQREQKLTIDGLEGRITSLEKSTQNLSNAELASIRSELTSLKQTVSSIDASRAQLTSRLVRLSDAVGQLQSRIAGQ